MEAQRDANGFQIANPQKFPDGFKNVTDFLHNLGLKSGLYTAKGNRTCAGFAASCEHEVQDAAQWASWGVDYVKEFVGAAPLPPHSRPSERHLLTLPHPPPPAAPKQRLLLRLPK